MFTPVFRQSDTVVVPPSKPDDALQGFNAFGFAANRAWLTIRHTVLSPRPYSAIFLCSQARASVHLTLVIYARAGIPHYWIVDPEKKTLEAFALSDTSRYTEQSYAEGIQVFTHPDYPGLTIPLGKLWEPGRL